MGSIKKDNNKIAYKTLYEFPISTKKKKKRFSDLDLESICKKKVTSTLKVFVKKNYFSLIDVVVFNILIKSNNKTISHTQSGRN